MWMSTELQNFRTYYNGFNVHPYGIQINENTMTLVRSVQAESILSVLMSRWNSLRLLEVPFVVLPQKYNLLLVLLKTPL